MLNSFCISIHLENKVSTLDSDANVAAVELVVVTGINQRARHQEIHMFTSFASGNKLLDIRFALNYGELYSANAKTITSARDATGVNKYQLMQSYGRTCTFLS